MINDCLFEHKMNASAVTMSPFQHREWVQWKMADGRNGRIVAAALKLTGPISEDIVRARLKEAIRCHTLLRMMFSAVEPSALILPDGAVTLEVRHADPREDLPAAVTRIAGEAARNPFVLSSAPGLVAILVCAGSLEDQESALLLLAHPIIADQRSLQQLLDEVNSNRIPELTDRAFIDWTSEPRTSAGSDLEEHKLNFHRKHLDGASFRTDLPTDHKRPPIFQAEGALVTIAIPDTLHKAMSRIADEHGTSLKVIFLASLIGYLGRTTRQPDIVVGVATDLRSPDCEASVGPFENTSVLRIRLDDGPTTRHLFQRVHDSLEEVESRYNILFERLLEALQPERDPAWTPLYQVRFAHRRYPVDHARLAAPTGFVSSDLEVTLEECGATLTIQMGYRTDLFESETMLRMGGHLIELLQGMLEEPEKPVHLIALCTPRERAWILATLGIQRRFPVTATLHQLVSTAADRYPENVAVCSGDTRLSYRELNQRANRLAHHLRKLGIQKDAAVAVCMERSEELIIALLAILKAGGTYVPIEPSNPKARIEYVLNDSKTQLVLTDPLLRDKVEGSAASVVTLERGGAAFAAESAEDPEEVTDPSGLAYIIYTSGSTGRPKGVLIEHHNVVRLFHATRKWFDFSEQDVWTMFHSVAFDFSVWEIWGALIYGGRLVVVPYLVSRSPKDFYHLLKEEQVTVLNQTPSAFRQLIEAETEIGPSVSALRLVIFGGEALEFESLRRWFDRHGDQHPRLINMYGITETCVHVTYRPVSIADLDAGQGASIIGTPIPDLCAFVVDEALQLLPPGIPGELVVGGAGLARGYNELTELTAARFVPNLFSGDSGERLYRSGDLVRLLPTGELDYLGRLDFQVQIRGFRIETGEIEAVLRRSGLVRDVTVVPWQRSPDETVLVAYVVSDRPTGDLRAATRESLPEYMVPTHFVSLPVIPITVNGKVDRKALPPPQATAEAATAGFVAPSDDLERLIAQVWCEVLNLREVSTHESFFDIGGTSLAIVRVATALRERLRRAIEVVKFFQFPTISALAKHLRQTGDSLPEEIALTAARTSRFLLEDEPMAIIGMAGRFPGAPDLHSLWEVLARGVETITFFADNDLDPGIDPALVADPDYVKARGIVEGAEFFDAEFFGMSPIEADITDPQQRLLLELAWEALEHAAYDPSTFPGLIGVYAGIYNNTYYLENLLKRPDALADAGAFQVMAGNEKDFVATRIAHRLDLKGPALSIHTACSTSLVAVCEAFYALRNNRCDLALAGAAAVTCPQKSGYLYQEGGMLSPDGHTRPFDEQAGGTVFSDGAAVVVLRRLSEALAARDTIYAVIRGAAINNDGGERMSFSAPSVHGQARVIAGALAVAGVHPDTIDYIEAHGTATPLGDPIEVAGLKQAFGALTPKRNCCALGSIKSNLGHLTAAAGVAGLIKTALALTKEQIPATIGFLRANPELSIEDSPFYIAATSLPWPKRAGEKRRAGVSSFGVGGTNAHVVLEEAPSVVIDEPSRPQQLLLLSAKSDRALEMITARLADHLEKYPETNLADVAFTLQRGRKAFVHRRALVAASAPAAVNRLRSPDPRLVYTGKAAMTQEPTIVFLFPGQGAQHVNMGRELYVTESVFREELQRCSAILAGHLGLELSTVLYPEATGQLSAEMEINQTWLAQPAIFMVEYALARLWMSWGLKPAILIGHSIGEYVAAVLAETFTLEEALELLSARAKLMQDLPAGSMLTVRTTISKIEAMLPEDVSIAAVNSPSLCVVSGATEALRDFQQTLDSKGIIARFLHTSHAFHSAMMDPMLSKFEVIARRIPNRPPKLPWASTCTGHWITAEDLADGRYWVRQVRQTVRFADALSLVVEDPRNLLLEVGPGQTLSQLARQHGKKSTDLIVIPSLGPSGESVDSLASTLAALGRLWVAGVKVDWSAFYTNEKRRRIALPSYPFERKRHWIEPPRSVSQDPEGNDSPVAPQTMAWDGQEEAQMQSVSETPTETVSTRADRLVGELRELLQRYSGVDQSGTAPEESFVDLGFDSLLLTQVSQGILKRFGVKVTFRQLFGDLSTLRSLAAFLDDRLPPEALPKAAQPPTPVNPAATQTPTPVAADRTPTPIAALPTPASDSNLLAGVIQRQIAVMAQQLELLRHGQAAGMTEITAPHALTPVAPTLQEPALTAVKMEKENRFGPFKPIEKGTAGGLTPSQQVALDKLVARYNQRTAKSKAMAQKHRAYFCDPRAAGNFRQAWKEMVYPIVCARSKGARIWDVDGNEYIDVTMGFGTNYLGHSPDFVMTALAEQLHRGIEIGPQSPLAGEVARLLCELTGMERATFCNTGSEAVMAAIRVARTVTGKEKIVYFHGDYHGIFDEVLGRPALRNGVPAALPIAPGIPDLTNVMILEYGSPSALAAIRSHADEIAAVLVEPVQSRHPDLQPREFLHELRNLTLQNEVALIFDEVITGFRVALGGAQEYFGVKADLATYGKVIGGGMPIGVLAGAACYMDALDGGFWQFGDDSAPPTGVTFFAGTFVRHPLAMAAAHAVLKYLKTVGPALQERTNQLTARFVERVNEFFDSRNLPMRLQTFSALFYYDFHEELKFAGLLFYYLRDRGIHIWEGRVGCLSVAHTEQDMESVLRAFQDSVVEMQAGGFLPESAGMAVTLDPRQVQPLEESIKGQERSRRHSPKDMNRLPVAEAQREMWLGAQMRPEAAGPHHACTGLYLDGNLNLNVLQQAITRLIRRHEGLRCSFSEDGAEVILHTPPASEIPVYDFSTLDAAQCEARVQEILHQEGQRLFDLVEAPLVKFQIIRLAPQRHLLIFTAQMIICDGWSHYVVFEDLGTIYNALIDGVEPELPPAASMRQYADWEMAYVNTDEARECEDFWFEQFKTVPPVSDLPTARTRPPVRTFTGDRRELILPAQLCRDIKQLAKNQKNSYFAVLLAVFQVWLHRLSGADDLVMGVPFAAQGQLGMDSLVGQCTHTLPLRIQLQPEELFSEILKRTWSSVLDAQEHWAFSYGRLIPKLELPRDPSRIPLVSVLFNIDPPMTKVRFKDIRHRFVTGPRYYFQYDLGFNLVEGEETICVECDYNPNLFDGDVIESWITGYKAMLEAVVADPDQRLSRLPMLAAEDHRWLLAGDVRPASSDPSNGKIHTLIERQAEQRADSIAITCEGESLDHATLIHRSGQVASRLRALGTTSGTVIGVCAKRSLDTAVAMLAILKADGAYVLLEPSLSNDDVTHIVHECGIKLIMTDDHTPLDFLGKPVQILSLNGETGGGAAMDGAPFAFAENGERLAGIIYEPSPEGKPVGIKITHDAVVNLLLSLQRQVGLTAQDRVLWHSPLSGGLEVLELWLPLSVGAQTAISPGATVLDPGTVEETIRREQITVMQATPAAWRMLLAFGWKGDRKLKALCRGEALPRDVASGLVEGCAEVWHLYGCAEATVCSMVGQVHSKEMRRIRQPIDNTTLMLVDKHREPVPVGVPGEILVTGIGLGCHYSASFPSASAKFGRHPIGDLDFGSFCRTGDLARSDSEGKFELLGGADSIIEFGGFRVELRAVESALLSDTELQDAVVSFRKELPGDPGLVAHIVPHKSKEHTDSLDGREIVKELRRKLRSLLPEYMHPAYFVVMDSLPRKADGRIDREVLPLPTEKHDDFEDYVVPKNKTEMILAGIWQELLGLEKVSTRDSFFDLSGSSLLAVRLFARIEKEFKRKLPLAMLFRAPTIEQLALALNAGDEAAAGWPSLVPIQPEGSKPPLFLVHGAGGNILLYSALAKHLAPDYPLYGLQSQGLDGKSKPLKTVEEMAEHYLQEIRGVQAKGPYFLGGYCLGGTIAYEMAQRLLLEGETVSLIAMLDTYNFRRAVKAGFISFLVQKFKFHWSNFFQLKPRHMWRYLREKRRIAADGGWAHIRTEMPGSTLQLGLARAESGVEATVQEINDHAGDIYAPKPYPGTLTLFKPQKNYKFYPDPQMGWGDLALTGLDIVEMPVNPHAMLLDPYVEMLAGELKVRLDRDVECCLH